MSKSSRLISFLLTLILTFSFFTVNSLAAEDDNLISSDMSNWQYQDVNGEWNIPTITYNSSTNSNILAFGPESISQGDIFAVYDLSSERLKSGDSYHFTLSLNSQGWPNNTGFFGANALIIGFATVDNDGFIQFQNDCSIDISSDNFSSFSVSDTLLTVDYDFVCPSYVGTPCFCIAIVRIHGFEHSNLTYNFSDLSLSRNINPEFDGILGWLQELYNSIVNGFTNLGDNLTNVWQRITTKLGDISTNITSSITDSWQRITTKLGDISNNITGSITDSWQRITTKLGEINTYISGEIKALGDKLINYILYFGDTVPQNPFNADDSSLVTMRERLQDIVDYINDFTENIQDVLSSVTAGIFIFTEFVENNTWLFLIVTFVLFMIVISRVIGL